MKLQMIFELPGFRVLAEGNPRREISRVFCCDLLSIAMGKAPADGVWVTVMGNRNTLAVASLTDTACIILAEGVSLDEATLEKALLSSPRTCLFSMQRLRFIRRVCHDSPFLRPAYPFLPLPMR